MNGNRFSARLMVVMVTVGGWPAVAAWSAETKAGRDGRELTTDRPDTTETPFTVEPGRVQLEASVASWTRDRQQGVKTTEWEVAPFNARVGITPRTELGIFVTPQVRRTEEDRSGAKTVTRGVGDSVLRAKVNFTGNDGGAFGSGVMLDVKVPTAADGIGNDKTELAVTFPVTFEVGAGWDGAAMTTIERAYTDAGKYEGVWTNTFSLAREVVTDVGVFFEAVSTTGVGRHVLVFDCGVTRRLGPNLQLDAGVNIGVSKTAPDLGAFVGFARRW